MGYPPGRWCVGFDTIACGCRFFLVLYDREPVSGLSSAHRTGDSAWLVRGAAGSLGLLWAGCPWHSAQPHGGLAVPLYLIV